MQAYTLFSSDGQEPIDEWIRLGVVAQVDKKLADAEKHYLQALRLDPNNAIATANLAVLYVQLVAFPQALMAIERASLFHPNHAIIWATWSMILLDMENPKEALEKAKVSLGIKPTIAGKRAMAVALAKMGRVPESIPYWDEILDENPKDEMSSSNVCYYRTLAGLDTIEVQQSRKRWYEEYGYKGLKYPHGNDQQTDRLLRVGYVSGDFHRHSAAYVFSKVIIGHDRNKIRPYCYSTTAATDDFSQQFIEKTEWREVSNLDDAAFEALVRKDEIDILVDLSGHTSGNRLLVFTRKPAPIQVTAWGFAQGTGIQDIDYFFADPISVPDLERVHYTEKIYDLPCIVTCSIPDYGIEDITGPPPIRTDPDGIFTFGTFSRFEKLSDTCLAAWSEILNRVPDSRLLLKDWAYRRPDAIQRVREQIKVDPSRLLFALDTSHPDQLKAYRQCDLILDSFPAVGGTVSLEQLYMGVPILTLYGKNPAERITSSILSAIGRKEWIAWSVDEYVDMAVQLARDPDIQKVRKVLRTELLQSPVCSGYVTAVEDAYHKMWTQYREKMNGGKHSSDL